ncbi:MAG: hypothetical protein ABI579_03065 [Candidatus Sumerlaeota bacterium]
MYRHLYSAAALAVLASLCGNAYAFDPAAGDFAKTSATDIRVMEYNVEDFFVSNASQTGGPLKRIFTAINPDIIVLEEMDKDVATATVKSTLEGYFPGSTWTVHRGATDGFDRNMIATRYTLTMTITDTVPASDTDIGLRGCTAGLVSVPSIGSIYVMGAHWKCCTTGTTEHQKRQKAADGIINWMRDARTVGGNIDLPTNTPMMVVGDYNVGQDGNDDLAPYHASQTIINGDIFDNATYGADSPPDWDGTDATDAVPYDHTSGNPRTWPSNSTPGSRLDRFTYTDSVIRATNRFILSTRTMSAGALSAAGLTATDTPNGPDHMPTCVDFSFGGETTIVGVPLVNEFSYNDVGTDNLTFLELINTGTRPLNLEAPVAYRFLRTDNNAPTAIPVTENESSNTISLRGVIPPGGLFVVYNSAGQSSTVAATITSALPLLQRQNTTAFSLFDGPSAGVAIVSDNRTADGDDVYTNVDAYLYEDAAPAQDNYLRTNTAVGTVITFGAAQSTSVSVISDTQGLSRNVGDFSADSFANWTIPQTLTPGEPNAGAATPSPSPSPSPAEIPTPSISPTLTPTAAPSPTNTPSLQQGWITS